MAAAWPSTLQSELNEEGFAFETGSTVIRSDNQTGPAKIRRTMTKSIDKVNGTINLNPAQFTTFQYFFDTTVNGGAGTFMFNHPITGVSTEFRFLTEPRYASLGGGMFRVSLSWETVPT